MKVTMGILALFFFALAHADGINKVCYVNYNGEKIDVAFLTTRTILVFENSAIYEFYNNTSSDIKVKYNSPRQGRYLLIENESTINIISNQDTTQIVSCASKKDDALFCCDENGNRRCRMISTGHGPDESCSCLGIYGYGKTCY
jgi:hypothetical protein